MIIDLAPLMPEYKESQVYVEYTDTNTYLYVVAKERVGRKEEMYIKVYQTQTAGSQNKMIILNTLEEIGYMSIAEYDRKYRDKHILLDKELDI